MCSIIDGEGYRSDWNYTTLSDVTGVLRPLNPAHCRYLLF